MLVTKQKRRQGGNNMPKIKKGGALQHPDFPEKPPGDIECGWCTAGMEFEDDEKVDKILKILGGTKMPGWEYTCPACTKKNFIPWAENLPSDLFAKLNPPQNGNGGKKR
jgi:hypothetical protein